MTNMMIKTSILSVLLIVSFRVSCRSQDFRSVVESRLQNSYGTELSRICSIDTDPVAERVFWEYGAIFVSNNGGNIPGACIFDDELRVQAFQKGMGPVAENIGGTAVVLQKSAMAGLLAARKEAAKIGRSITPRGGTAASTRSYTKTVDLWKSRFEPGLAYWSGRGKINRTDAAAARIAPITSQVRMVLNWEDRGWYFSKDLSKSILYSVAVPGASQHIFMLALDVEQYGDRKVREILARNGWFQTVKSDAPHFTFLGVSEAELPSLGLTAVEVAGQTYWIPRREGQGAK